MSYTKLLIVLGFLSFLPLTCSSSDDRLETWTTANETFQVRITTFEEKGLGLTGTSYVFESAPLKSDQWREFMRVRHDDRPEIPKQQVRFVNARVGYVFMGWMYAVTTDGGGNWSVWNATRDVSDWSWNRYGVMKDVSIHEDGSGTMTLAPLASAEYVPPKFRTEDFGRHWIVEK